MAWGVALGGQPGGLHPQWAGRVTRAVIANAPHPAIFQRLLASTPQQREASQYIRSEEHTSELQSLMRISYAVFCLKKKKYTIIQNISYVSTLCRINKINRG